MEKKLFKYLLKEQAQATFDSPDGIGTAAHVSFCWANISHVIYFSYSTITQNGTSRCQKNMAKIVQQTLSIKGQQ